MRAGLEPRQDRGAVERAGRPLLPLDADRPRAALGVPAGAAHDRQRRRRAAVGAETNDTLDARQRQRRRDVDRAGAAAEHRAMPDGGEEQVGRPNVDAKPRRAVALGDDVDARRRGADQPPRLARLQLHLAGRRRRGDAGELAVMRRAAGGMADDAVAHEQLAGRLLPDDRRRVDEPRPRGRGGQTQHVPGVDHARRAAGEVDAELAGDLGDHPLARLRGRALVPGLGLARMEVRQAGDHRRHVAVQAVGRRGEQAHPRERHVELLGDEHRQRRVGALPHLAAVHGQHDGAVAGDLDPAVEAHLAGVDGERVDRAEPVARRQQRPADDQRTGGADAAHEQRSSLHALPAEAASRIAARRRG